MSSVSVIDSVSAVVTSFPTLSVNEIVSDSDLVVDSGSGSGSGSGSAGIAVILSVNDIDSDRLISALSDTLSVSDTD